MSAKDGEVNGLLEEEPFHNSILGNFPVPAEVASAGKEDSENAEEKEQMHYPKVHLFFSFDIVNSTMYKALTGNWPLVIRSLLEDIRSRVHRIDALLASYLWRVIGDEMIFVLPIQSETVLVDAVDAIFEVTQRVSISLRNGRFFDLLVDQSVQDSEIRLLKSQNTLSIKAAAWIAVINDKNESAFDNIVFDYSASSQSRSIREFLGKDIDAGFRLKEYTQDRRLCISVELAYLLVKNKQTPNLQIMDYVRLKGVWNENLYPIIWYYNSEIAHTCALEMTGMDARISFAKSFRYDETDNNPMVKKYFSRLRMEQQRNIGANECELAKSMFFAKKALPKIVLDRNLRPKIEYFKRFLTGELMVTESEPYAHPLELHCAVVCCDVHNRKVLITHRSSEHTTNPGKWEFGCAKVGSEDALIQTVTHHYKTAFGIDIELVLDQSRKDEQPIPIAIYELKKRKNNIAKGVILVAKVRKPINPEAFRPEGEHDQICWIGKNELDNYSEDDAVNDFHNTLKKVFENFDSYFPKEGATNAK